jgi:signal transduction histidine kinase
VPAAAHAPDSGRSGALAGPILDALQAAISVLGIDPDGNAQPPLLYANRAYRGAFGDLPHGHLRLAATLRARGGLSAEHEDRELGRWFEVVAQRLLWSDGRPVTLQVAHDITARKVDAEIGRRELEKMELTTRLMAMGELASSLAHELNQPLAAIVNYATGIRDRLRAGSLPPDQLLAAVDSAVTQAERAASIVRRMRDFVRRSPPHLRAVGAARIIAAAISFVEPQARARGVVLEAQIAPQLDPLHVDPILIEQVVLNLLKNAIEAFVQPDPGTDAQPPSADSLNAAHLQDGAVRRVIVAAQPVAGRPQVQLSIIDHGCGIAPSYRSRLFEPFFTTKADGLGIGLNLCRSIVEFHHGRLELIDAPGGGTIARFTLPVAPLGSDATP